MQDIYTGHPMNWSNLFQMEVVNVRVYHVGSASFVLLYGASTTHGPGYVGMLPVRRGCNRSVVYYVHDDPAYVTTFSLADMALIGAIDGTPDGRYGTYEIARVGMEAWVRELLYPTGDGLPRS